MIWIKKGVIKDYLMFLNII